MSLNQAVHAVAAGGTVLVDPGTYTQSVTITQPLTLEANPAEPGSVVIDAKGQTNGVLITASNVTVKGLTIENAQQAGLLAAGRGALTHLDISNNTIKANDQGMTPQLNAKGIDYEALHVMGVDDSRITGNRVIDNLDGGIYLTDETAPTFGNVVANNLVEGNQVDCGITLASHVGHHGVYDNAIVNNESIGNTGAGILLATPVPYGNVSHNVVANNLVRGNMLGGVTLHTHPGAPGAQVADNIIVQNTIGKNLDMEINASTVGVEINAAGEALQGTVVEDNTITGNHYAVFETPWLTPGTVVTNNSYSLDAYKAPDWVPFSFLASIASYPPGALGSNWIAAQTDVKILLHAGVKTDAQYLAAVHGKASAAAVIAAQALYRAYDVFR